MRWYFSFLVLGILVAVPVQAATLKDRVPEAFLLVFGRTPTATEKTYWTARVTLGEKKTYEALRDAMYYQKDKAKSTAATGAKTTTAKPDDKQTMIKEVLPLFITIFGNDPTNTEKAWWRKRISCGEIKTMKALTSSMNFHKLKKARKGSDAICGAKPTASSSGSGVTRRGVEGIGGHVLGEEVRIGIFKTDGKAIQVTSTGEYQLRHGRNELIGKVGKDDVVSVSWSSGEYHVRGSGINFDGEQEIRLVPLSGAIMQLKNFSDPSQTIPGKNYNRFRGIIEIRKCKNCNELWAINELRTELYLRGLAETSGNGPEEYLKALGVAARTYVLYHHVVTGGRQMINKGYDIGSTADDQIYRGYEFEIITPRFSSILNATKGIIATNGEGDKPISTVYFSDSDGRTRSAKEVWNSSRFPYLQSVADPHHVAKSCNGHCVGMSAQGAYGFANKDGWSYQKILNYYYKGIKLVKAY